MWYLCLPAIEFLPEILLQKQPPGSVLRKTPSENMQQIYRRRSMQKCDFNNVVLHFIEITLQHGCSPVNLLHFFRTPLSRNTSGWMLLILVKTDFKLRHGDLARKFILMMCSVSFKLIQTCLVPVICSAASQNLVNIALSYREI